MTTLLDIRDIEPGQTYWCVVGPDDRRVMAGMFYAAFEALAPAKDYATGLGVGFRAVKTIKPV